MISGTSGAAMQEQGKQRVIRLVLLGYGAVNRHLCQILLEKAAVLQSTYGVIIKVVGVADSGGGAYASDGFDLKSLLDHKNKKLSVADHPQASQRFSNGLEVSAQVEYEILVEATTVNLTDGEPAVSCIRTALSRGKAVVLANKSPLVLYYEELTSLAKERRCPLLASATVCGGLPVLNVGVRDMTAAVIHKVEGIFNSTSNFILSAMEGGKDYESSLQEAQRLGIAEADPSLDVGGWDTANKLVIIANSVLRPSKVAKLSDVRVQGITDLSHKDLAEAKARGNVIKLLACAERQADGNYNVNVAPKEISKSSFLGSVSSWEMGIVFTSDLFEVLSMKIDEPTVIPTAAAVLRDIIHAADHLKCL